MATPYQQSAQTTNYSSNSLNEYTSVGGTSQSSDANGNLTDNGTYLFAYDYRNHVVQVKLKSNSSTVATYKHDALGRRVEKNVGGTVERHILSIWNDPGVVEDLSHVVAVFDGSNGWKQNFVWSDEVDGIQMLEQKDVLDFDTDGNTTEVTRSFYHRNALGSVMEITDMNQAEVVSYRYDPYGKVAITRGGTPQSSDPLGNHWTFTGRFLDEETTLYHYRARCYDPLSGRFAQRDPLGYDPGPSLYCYAGSAPVSRVDPTGTDVESFDYPKVSFLAGLARDLEEALANGDNWEEVHAASALAKAKARKLYEDNWLGERGDAFLHCYWSCLVCTTCGAKVAQRAGEIHEELDKEEVAADSTLNANSVEYWTKDSEKDYHNNNIGIRCCLLKLPCEICCGGDYWSVEAPPVKDPEGGGPTTPGSGGAGGAGSKTTPRQRWALTFNPSDRSGH